MKPKIVRGRAAPRLPPLRVSNDERAWILAQAQAQGVSLTRHMRDRLLASMPGYGNGNAPAGRFFVEVVETTTGEVVKRLGPMTEFKADKVESGLLINLNHERFFTRSVPESDSP